eukprot:scaffold12145_cov139-Amphora_coffeaeformis.AAC.7
MSFFWGSAVKKPQPEPQAQLDPMAGMTPHDRLQYMQAETRAAEVEAFRENRAFFNTAIRKEQELAEKRHKILEDGLALETASWDGPSPGLAARKNKTRPTKKNKSRPTRKKRPTIMMKKK